MKGIEKRTSVVCVNDNFKDASENPFRISELVLPVLGNRYTIRDISETNYGIGVLLEEIKNREYYFENINQKREPIFGISRFEKTKE
ncbi:MAG: hypothetical protein WC895_02265 [Candidatus Shapirobacteria bacterium]|jgi:hypothetical protein